MLNAMPDNECKLKNEKRKVHNEIPKCTNNWISVSNCCCSPSRMKKKSCNNHKKNTFGTHSCSLVVRFFPCCSLFLVHRRQLTGWLADWLVAFISYDSELCVRTQPIAKFFVFSFIFICVANLLLAAIFLIFALLCSFFIISHFLSLSFCSRFSSKSASFF